ncbi:MAG: hypothetical protein IJF53_07345, partial [Clostridia bacterium]|nr:hypothetical protein [Clostridia bacterium]
FTGSVVMPLLLRMDPVGMLASQAVMCIMAAGIFLWIRQGRDVLRLNRLSSCGAVKATEIYLNFGMTAYMVLCLAGFVISVI